MDPGYRNSHLKTTNLNIAAYSFSFFSLAPTYGNLLGVSSIYLTRHCNLENQMKRKEQEIVCDG